MKGKKLLSKVLLTTMMGLAVCGTTGMATEDSSDVEIEVFFMNPWVNIAPSGADFLADYISETYGGTWKMTLASEGETELIARMAAGDAPDLIQFGTTAQHSLLYEQGVLLEDWNDYADQMPTWLANMSENDKTYYTTEDGKLSAITPMAGNQCWAFMIRQDWLKNLNLEMPTNAEELLDVMRAFTFDDPDGNGVNDTYGFTVAGAGSVGELSKLLLLYDNLYLYIKDGEVTNAIVEGTYKQYLNLAKTIVEEGLINPDWYTIGWDDRKPSLYQGQYGIVWYPPAALLNEMIEKQGLTEEEADALAANWAVMDACGGKGLSNISSITDPFSVSAECAEDAAKMEIICKFFEDCSSFNDSFANVRSMVFKYPEGTRGYEIENGTYTLWTMSPSEYDENPEAGAELDELKEYLNGEGNYGWWNWGMLVNHCAGSQFDRQTKASTYASERIKELTAEVLARETWDNVSALYSADATLEAELKDKQAEYAIKYIMGEVEPDSYDNFVEEYLAAGGQEYLDAAKEQFIGYGLIQ